MITVWQGSANTWDCDEMGHMNVRVYVEKAMEGLGALAHAMKLPRPFRAGATSTLIPVDQHIRFIREVLPGRPLSMQACILEAGKDDVLVYQDMRHGDGTPAAAFRTRLVHAEAASGRPFPWSRRTREAIAALSGTPPEDTEPRSLQPGGPCLPEGEVTLDEADALGVPVIGMGMVLPGQCDVHGRIWAPWFMGRVSDAVPNLLYDWRERVAAGAGGKRMGAAVLEYRLVYRRWPKPGDLFEVRSSLARVERKFHSLVHWALDPVSGRAWMTSEAVAVTFDLDARTVLETAPAQMAELEQIAPRGLAI